MVDLPDEKNLIHVMRLVEEALKYFSEINEKNSIKDNLLLKHINDTLFFIGTTIQAYKQGLSREDFLSSVSALLSTVDTLSKYTNKEKENFNFDYVSILAGRLRSEIKKIDLKSSENIDEKILYLNKAIIEIKNQIKYFDSETKIRKILEGMDSKYKQISEIEMLAQSKFSEITENLEQNSKKIAETVGKLSTDAVSGRFNSRALEEKKSAGRMQWSAIILMCTAISLIFLSATRLLDFWGWQDLLVRSLSTITLFITAGYFANEANKHRRLQHKYERIHLDLSAIDPFIATFDDETQRALKSEVARRVFVTSHGEDFAKVVTKEDTPTNLAEVMGEMLKVLKTLNKKDG